VARIGGHHFNELIHWCEDREFDFRLQLAGIGVNYLAGAVIHHDAQTGLGGMRSYFRYGVGEAIGQELGVFLTPSLPLIWRLGSDVAILWRCLLAKGPGAALFYTMLLAAFHAGTLRHLLFDPYDVRRRYPRSAGRVRALRSIPQHCTELTARQRSLLRAGHQRRGAVIEAGRGAEDQRPAR
jgi:hypothetical protein